MIQCICVKYDSSGRLTYIHRESSYGRAEMINFIAEKGLTYVAKCSPEIARMQPAEIRKKARVKRVLANGLVELEIAKGT